MYLKDTSVKEGNSTMAESIEVSDVFPVTQKDLYLAWLDSRKHGAFTGGGAVIDPAVGGKFTAWDGYIEGKTKELQPFKRIVQSWRTTNFPASSPDSELEVFFETVERGTKITLRHSNIPTGQGQDYKQGWKDHYFTPMKEYFS
jgi:activator of HSP90 ATPase